MLNSLNRIKCIVQKEVWQLKRDKLTFGMAIMIPFIQLLLFGFAINTDVRNIPVGVVDQSEMAIGRMVTESVKVTQVVDVIKHYNTPKEAEYAITKGEVKAVLIIPTDINQRLVQKRSIAQWIVDGSDSMISSAIMGLQNMPITDLGLSDMKMTKTFEVALFYNPTRRSAVNIIPGLTGIILTMTMVLFTSLAIVKEREQGNLELLITTPLISFELMVAKIIPYIIIGLVQVTIILGLGYLIFNLPINGDLFQIFLGSLLFIAASLSLGLIISTIAKTQIQSMQMTIFVLLPSILLSGFMFPYESMPIIAQWISEIFPATHFMRIIRAVILRGADLSDVWQDTLWLSIFTVVGLLIAAKRFSKTLD
ncbi:MAG: ABC transporter [Chloroflexi bacterium]|nr:ABC transporter [Chloroflexota bacterium]|tara:strand:- start:17918 stop:19015 length:1098 start_codon:yes stop_codon:yes gene_type:complete